MASMRETILQQQETIEQQRQQILTLQQQLQSVSSAVKQNAALMKDNEQKSNALQKKEDALQSKEDKLNVRSRELNSREQNITHVELASKQKEEEADRRLASITDWKDVEAQRRRHDEQIEAAKEGHLKDLQTGWDYMMHIVKYTNHTKTAVIIGLLVILIAMQYRRQDTITVWLITAARWLYNTWMSMNSYLYHYSGEYGWLAVIICNVLLFLAIDYLIKLLYCFVKDPNDISYYWTWNPFKLDC